MTILVIWAVSGEVGPAEQALQLKTTDGPNRFAAITLAGIEILAFWRFLLAQGWRRLAWLAAAFAVAVSGVGAIAVAVAVVVAVVNGISAKQGWQDKFLTLFVLIEFTVCVAAANYSSVFPGWRTAGPLLLFLGLLTLVNAPFDWLSLGLTRLLLRRGIKQGGPWPYFYAVIDALAASALIALLAVAMVSATDLFEHLAELGGGDTARVLPPMRVFVDDLRAAPQKPEYWWVYATLFSTMLPSVINLFIAGFSFLRGLPMLRKWLLGVMRENESMQATDCIGAALILTSQGAVALVFAVSAQAFLTWGVVYHFMPRLGLGFLDLAKKVAM